ncbi:unnamed protein product [Rhizophagus irregularis]|nr:unnamed protein product [Rhizophagus irregularis]
MENQESGNLSTTNDYDDLDDLIYYDDDDGGGGGEKNKITKPCKLSLINHRNIAYNILKYLEDDMVKNKEIPELGQCSECHVLRSNFYIPNPAHAHFPTVERMSILLWTQILLGEVRNYHNLAELQF